MITDLDGHRCPKCGSHANTVTDTRKRERGRVRYRRCHDCRAAWKTIEIPYEADVSALGAGLMAIVVRLERDVAQLRARIETWGGDPSPEDGWE